MVKETAERTAHGPQRNLERCATSLLQKGGRAFHLGRSTAVVEGEVYDKTGDLVAKALGITAILRY